MTTLVVGGTSGLGLELARDFAELGNDVVITGRSNPKADSIAFQKLELSEEPLASKIKTLIMGHYLPEEINVLVFAAGFYQEGTVTDLSEKQIEEMINVCGRSLVYLCKYLLEKQGRLDELITITSTSQWTPRKLEPIYNFAKAAAGHFSNSMAEDGRIKKVMVAGPAGMKTPFWDDLKRDDVDEMNNPKWVADQIMAARKGAYRYKFIHILRQPPRLEVVETR